jgi:hypothetical protein
MLAALATLVLVAIHTPCGPELAASSERVATGDVGSLTVSVLNDHDIPFVGSESGINSIFGTPTGDAAIEVIDDRSMRAYGWCYSVDGVVPDVMPDAYELTGTEASIAWFFAYSSYEDGAWRRYCVPTHVERPAFVCSR